MAGYAAAGFAAADPMKVLKGPSETQALLATPGRRSAASAAPAAMHSGTVLSDALSLHACQKFIP